MIKLLISKLTKVLLTRSPVQWHDLRSLQPVSRQFGLDRGSPIDRYYMRKFLKENQSLITGKLIEIGDDHFSRMYGVKVSSYDILHVVKSKSATIVGDL